MEVRYLFLHPADTSEILFSTPLIRALVKSVEYAEVISAVPKEFQWLLENNPYLSSVISFDKNPKKEINLFRDVGADYLIDLNTGRKNSWFKNRLRVMDFTMTKKDLKYCKGLESKEESFDFYSRTGFDLLSPFDLEDDGQGMDFFYGHNKSFVKDALPESFLENYAVLEMPIVKLEDYDYAGPVSELISRIERPIVLCGGEEWRSTGEEIMRRTGCTILSTCGDFTDQEKVFISAGARVLLNIEKGKEIWAMVLDKPNYFIDISTRPESWKMQVDSIRKHLRQK